MSLTKPLEPKQPQRDIWAFTQMFATGRKLTRHIRRARAAGEDYSEAESMIRELSAMWRERFASWMPNDQQRNRPN